MLAVHLPILISYDVLTTLISALVGSGVVEQPLGYAGQMEDIANTVVFMSSPASRYITGQVIYCDGGLINRGLMSALPDDGYPERDETPTMW